MAENKRKIFTRAEKAKVALAAVKGDKAITVRLPSASRIYAG